MSVKDAVSGFVSNAPMELETAHLDSALDRFKSGLPTLCLVDVIGPISHATSASKRSKVDPSRFEWVEPRFKPSKEVDSLPSILTKPVT